jgi:outer membrane protein
MKSNIKLIFASIFALINYLATNSVWAENLMDVYNLAKDNDQVLQAAYQEHLANLEALPQARALLLPTITANYNADKYNYKTNASNIPPLKYNDWQYNLTITQQIFQMSTWNELSQAEDKVKKAFATLADAEQSLLLRVSQQYFEVLKAKDDLYFNKAEQEADAKHLEQTKQRYKVGLSAITDVHDAQARYDSSYAKVIEAENSVGIAKEKLREIIGKSISNLAALKEEISLPSPNPTNIDEWVQTATTKNWGLQAARYNLILARKAIQQENADHFPTAALNATLGKGKNSSPLQTNDPNLITTNKTIGLVLAVPLFKGGLTYSKIKEASYKYEKASRDFETKYRSTESNARQTYSKVSTFLSKIKALKQAVISNDSALKATQAAYEVGNRTVVDVLDSQSALINAENDHSKARYDYIIQSLILKQTAGTLCVEDLQQVNTLLQ